MTVYFTFSPTEIYPNQNSLQAATLLAALIKYYAEYRVAIENTLEQEPKLKLINEATRTWEMILQLSVTTDLKPADVMAMVLREEKQCRTVIFGKK